MRLVQPKLARRKRRTLFAPAPLAQRQAPIRQLRPSATRSMSRRRVERLVNWLNAQKISQVFDKNESTHFANSSNQVSMRFRQKQSPMRFSATSSSLQLAANKFNQRLPIHSAGLC